MNRRAGDSGAQIRLFQQQHDVTASNTITAVQPAHTQSPLSNQPSRGSITRGAPITTPTFSITPHKVEEDNEALVRYLSIGKRHTVCEQSSSLIGKARRGTRESVEDCSPLSRRASDISSNLINNSARSNLEHLYNNAINSKANEDEAVATLSVQELQKLQKEVQNVSVSLPTNSVVVNIQHSHQQFTRPPYSFYLTPYHHQIPLLYYCNASPLFAQHSAIPTTASSYMP